MFPSEFLDNDIWSCSKCGAPDINNENKIIESGPYYQVEQCRKCGKLYSVE